MSEVKGYAAVGRVGRLLAIRLLPGQDGEDRDQGSADDQRRDVGYEAEQTTVVRCEDGNDAGRLVPYLVVAWQVAESAQPLHFTLIQR